MGVVLFAYHDVGRAALRVFRSLGVEVLLVHTHADDPGENRWFGSVREACGELGVPVAVGADPNAAAEVDRVRSLAPEAIFSFYYRHLLKRPLLGIPPKGAYNLHGSLLPRYRGRAPVNWMILNGETRGGVTLHHMVARADAGDVVDREEVPIGPEDTAVDLFARLVPATEAVLRRSVPRILAGTAPRERQDESLATTFGRRTPEDGRIDWAWPAERVRNLVRAVTDPYPGAFSDLEGRRVVVWRSRNDREEAPPGTPPGTVLADARGVRVACGDGIALALLEVEVSGARGAPEGMVGVFRRGARLGGTGRSG